MPFSSELMAMEESRRSRVVVFGASHLDLDLLAPLYETLRIIGHTERLDVVFYCRGGIVNAARRLALLLSGFTDRLCLFVPHYCESAGTLMSLAAHEIYAGPVAVFSPIDPLLMASGSQPGDSPMAISSQDVRLFSEMCRSWFGLDEGGDAQARAFSVICESIFPTTMTSFYRSTLESREIASELLRRHMPEGSEQLQASIVDKLLFGYHSHTYALTREDMKGLGLPVKTDEKLEAQAWDISCKIRSFIGNEATRATEEDWFDALIAVRDGARVRRRSQTRPSSVWEPALSA